MEKKFMTAMLSFVFLFVMMVNVQAQTLTDNANPYNVADKANAAYLNNLPEFQPSQDAMYLLKTEIVSNTNSLAGAAEGSTVANSLQSEIDLYNHVYRMIYREQLSVEEAILVAYQGMHSSNDATGTPTSYANAPELQNLVNLLSL